MYVPPHFREERPEALRQLMREHTLATLVTLGQNGLAANHLPLIFDPEPAPHGTLRGHLSRLNPQWSDFSPDVPALAIFQGASAYITPNWYPTKQETGRVVPTFNFLAVHAYGPLHVVEDAERLHRHLRALTDLHESALANGSAEAPWSIDDAPPEFIRAQMKSIVGIEIPIERIEGKWKVSQNRVAADRRGVIEGLRAAAIPQGIEIADWVERKLEDRE